MPDYCYSINNSDLMKYMEQMLPVVNVSHSAETRFFELLKESFVKLCNLYLSTPVEDFLWSSSDIHDPDLLIEAITSSKISFNVPIVVNLSRFLVEFKIYISHRDVPNVLFLFQMAVFEAKKLCPEYKTHQDEKILGLPDEIVSKIKQAASSSLPTLILGETGVGKEVVAEVIHRWSRRRGPFIAVNCGAIPHGLFENELFGHEPNSFTGSSRTGVQGKLEIANGGTLFLDEVGEIPLYSQAKLLRVIERKEFWKIGAVKPTAVDIKIIAATNKPLKELVKVGRFRKDLYYRLRGVELLVPPLRDRGNKLDELIFYFVQKFGNGRVKLAHDAFVLMKSHHWPGNVRELMYFIQLLCEEIKEGLITAEKVKSSLELQKNFLTFEEARKQFERDFVTKALEQNDWNVTKTAQVIGMSRRWLQLKMREFEIKLPRNN
ncbi:MAG: sigma 54-interacting transcriptional regulator [Candidatus Hydrothermia bacterium]